MTLPATVAGLAVADARPIGGGDIAQAYAVRLADGRPVFAKTVHGHQPGLLPTEATGLDWLRVEGGAPVPGVRAVDDEWLVLDWVDPGAPSAQSAAAFGRSLAVTHRSHPERFGWAGPTWVGSVRVDNAWTTDWPSFFVRYRLAPVLRSAADAHAIDGVGIRAVESVCDRLADLAGPAEPPARVHGDLWSGNVLWAADGRGWLVDPSAHGGHRETDLAMLALFGAPHLDRVLAAYDEMHPLADGWRDRVALHQVLPLLVHATLFGGHYGAAATRAAQRALVTAA